MKAEILVCFCLLISHSKLNSFVDSVVAKLNKYEKVEATNKFLSEMTTSSDVELTSNPSEKSTDGITIGLIENSTSESTVKDITVPTVKLTSQFVSQMLTKSTAEQPTTVHNEITTKTNKIILEHITTTEILSNATIESVLNETINNKDDDHEKEILNDHDDHNNEILHDHDKIMKSNHSILEVKLDSIKKEKTEGKKELKIQRDMTTDKLKYQMFISKKEFEIKPKKPADHNRTNEVPECFMLLANITKANEAKELDIGTEIPVCNVDGSFTSKQCSPAGYCRCVSKNGTSISEAKQGDLFCDCLRQRHDYWSFSKMPSHIPECDEHGYFKPKQCMDNSTICWCSTKDGNILTEPFEEVIDCDDIKMAEIKSHKNITMTEKNETSNHK